MQKVLLVLLVSLATTAHAGVDLRGSSPIGYKFQFSLNSQDESYNFDTELVKRLETMRIEIDKINAVYDMDEKQIPDDLHAGVVASAKKIYETFMKDGLSTKKRQILDRFFWRSDYALDLYLSINQSPAWTPKSQAARHEITKTIYDNRIGSSPIDIHALMKDTFIKGVRYSQEFLNKIENRETMMAFINGIILDYHKLKHLEYMRIKRHAATFGIYVPPTNQDMRKGSDNIIPRRFKREMYMLYGFKIPTSQVEELNILHSPEFKIAQRRLAREYHSDKVGKTDVSDFWWTVVNSVNGIMEKRINTLERIPGIYLQQNDDRLDREAADLVFHETKDSGQFLNVGDYFSVKGSSPIEPPNKMLETKEEVDQYVLWLKETGLFDLMSEPQYRQLEELGREVGADVPPRKFKPGNTFAVGSWPVRKADNDKAD